MRHQLVPAVYLPAAALAEAAGLANERGEEPRPERRRIYFERIRPLLRNRFFVPDSFTQEYAQLRIAPTT